MMIEVPLNVQRQTAECASLKLSDAQKNGALLQHPQPRSGHRFLHLENQLREM